MNTQTESLCLPKLDHLSKFTSKRGRMCVVCSKESSAEVKDRVRKINQGIRERVKRFHASGE